MDKIDELIDWLNQQRMRAGTFGLKMADLDYIVRELIDIKDEERLK